jgi:hypothetical protein
MRSRASAQEDRPGDYASQYFSVHDLYAHRSNVALA